MLATGHEADAEVYGVWSALCGPNICLHVYIQMGLEHRGIRLLKLKDYALEHTTELVDVLGVLCLLIFNNFFYFYTIICQTVFSVVHKEPNKH